MSEYRKWEEWARQAALAWLVIDTVEPDLEDSIDRSATLETESFMEPNETQRETPPRTPRFAPHRQIVISSSILSFIDVTDRTLLVISR